MAMYIVICMAILYLHTLIIILHTLSLILHTLSLFTHTCLHGGDVPERPGRVSPVLFNLGSLQLGLSNRHGS